MDAAHLKKMIFSLPDDHRLEVLMAELLENEQLNMDQWEVQAIGILHRGSKRDLENISALRGGPGRSERLVFGTTREGLYDALPSGLFHAPRSRKFQKSSDEISEELREQRAEEAAARDFFHPLEQVFFGYQLQLEQIERSVSSGFSSQRGREIFSRDFWGIATEGLNAQQITALLHVLPLSYLYKGNLPKVEMIMGVVLRAPVAISQQWGAPIAVEADLSAELGNSYLGVDTVIGTQLEDGLPRLQIEIGPIPAQELTDHLAEGPQARLRELLSDYFLPIDCPQDIHIRVRPEESHFELGDAQHTGRLGYTCTLA